LDKEYEASDDLTASRPANMIELAVTQLIQTILAGELGRRIRVTRELHLHSRLGAK
jgi:hypothetical protein